MMKPRTKRTFKFIFLTLFVDLLAFTLILPLLPKILDYYATNDKSNTYRLFNDNVKVLQNLLSLPESHNQVLLAGLIGSWFSFLQFVSSPIFGALSDKFGRKIILLTTLSGSALSYAIWLMASNICNLFILSRTIGGLSKANVGLSLAIVSDVSDESTRGKGMAMVGSSFSLAFIFGPLLGAYLSTLVKLEVGQELNASQLIVNPALIALLLTLADMMLVMFCLEETNNLKSRPNDDAHDGRKQILENGENILVKAFHFINPRSLFDFKLVKDKTQSEAQILKATSGIYFYYLLFYSGLEFTLSFLTHIRFGFSSMDQGKLYLFSGILMATIQGGYIRRIKGGREATIALVGLAIIVPSFFLMGLSSKVSHIYYSLTMYAISSAIVVPCLTTIISSHCPIESRGVVMGTFRSIGAMARASGPILASALFWTFGATICYIGGAIALLLPLYRMTQLLKQLKSSQATDEKKKIIPEQIRLAKAN